MSIRTNLAVAGLSLAVILGGVAAASASEMANPAADKMESHKTEAKNAGAQHKTDHKKNLSKKAETTTKDEVKK